MDKYPNRCATAGSEFSIPWAHHISRFRFSWGRIFCSTHDPHPLTAMSRRDLLSDLLAEPILLRLLSKRSCGNAQSFIRGGVSVTEHRLQPEEEFEKKEKKPDKDYEGRRRALEQLTTKRKVECEKQVEDLARGKRSSIKCAIRRELMGKINAMANTNEEPAKKIQKKEARPTSPRKCWATLRAARLL